MPVQRARTWGRGEDDIEQENHGHEAQDRAGSATAGRGRSGRRLVIFLIGPATNQENQDQQGQSPADALEHAAG
ncbi:MAG: hypothetical protein IPM84_20865 [Anaerolineae bacterium]|nr:hypothetical protein [Anaerolineae bacterium]